MPKVKYDVTGVEDAPDFTPAPKGTYRAKIADTTVGKASSGQPMLTIVFELTHDAKGKKLKETYGRVWHRVPLEHWEDTAGWTRRLREFIKALGLKEKGSFDPDKLEGESMVVVLKAGKDLDDNYRPDVSKLMPIQEDEDEDEEEDVEDEDEDEDEEEEDEDEDETEEDEEEDDDEDEEDEGEEEDEAEDYSDWSRNQLVKEARSRGIKVTKKHTEDELREALVEADGEGDDEEEEEEDEEEVDYSEWEADDLKKELKERGLKTSGSAKQMRARLEKDDESGDDPF